MNDRQKLKLLKKMDETSIIKYVVPNAEQDYPDFISDLRCRMNLVAHLTLSSDAIRIIVDYLPSLGVPLFKDKFSQEDVTYMVTNYPVDTVSHLKDRLTHSDIDNLVNVSEQIHGFVIQIDQALQDNEYYRRTYELLHRVEGGDQYSPSEAKRKIVRK